MADMSLVWLLLVATTLKSVAMARFPILRRPILTVECGQSPTIPANISYRGRQIAGLHAGEAVGIAEAGLGVGIGIGIGGSAQRPAADLQPQPCQSRMPPTTTKKKKTRKGSMYVHVIYDVFRPDCGPEISEDGKHYSVTVHVQHLPQGRHTRQKETTHTLSCHYDDIVNIHHNNDDNTFEGKPTITLKNSTKDSGVSPSKTPERPTQSLVNSTNAELLSTDVQEERTGPFQNGKTATALPDQVPGELPRTFKNTENTRRIGSSESEGKHTRTMKKNKNTKGIPDTLRSLLKRTEALHSGVQDKTPETLQTTPATRIIPSEIKDRPTARAFEGRKPASRVNPTHSLPYHRYPNNNYTSRIINDVDDRMVMPGEKDDFGAAVQPPPPMSFSHEIEGGGGVGGGGGSHSGDVKSMTASSSSVLQLNVVDGDGKMTAVVYPGKQVALELHAAHHNTLGVPVVSSCKVINPLQHSTQDNVANTPFSETILQYGCGEGNSLPEGSSFAKGTGGFTTPFFSIPTSWTRQTALLFSCDVIICTDVMRCRQKCPPLRRKPLTTKLHDISILLESQVVTSCPSVDDVSKPGDVRWGESLLPECLPKGHHLLQPVPSVEPTDGNNTAGAAGSDVNKTPAPSSWLAGHLHYIIIIVLLIVIIIIFMIATFCKMVAMQRHIRRTNKAVMKEQRERAISEHHQDQMTQTPRPLPRTPHGRPHTFSGQHAHSGQSLNRHSRQGGDGASVTVLQLDDGHVSVSPRPSSGPPHPPPAPSSHFDNVRRESLQPPPPVPQQRSSVNPRPLPYDIPPSHDQQQEYRASVSSGSPQSPFVFESTQRSSDVKSFQTSTTVEEKNSERHTTIIEIKNPNQRDPSTENCWKGPDHLGSFTGGGGTSNGGGNTLERGVVLGVNSLRRHLDRENQQVASQPRDRRPITAQHHEPLSAAHPVTVTAQMYYNTPAPCSEDSSLKELLLNSSSSPNGSLQAPTALGGIRTSPHRGSRKGSTPVVINTMEETTRL